MNKKIKILMLSDIILSPSGVATQTKYIVDALLKSGNKNPTCTSKYRNFHLKIIDA